MQEDRWQDRSATSCQTRSQLTFVPLRLSLPRPQSTSNSPRHIWQIKRLRYYCYSYLWTQRCLPLRKETRSTHFTGDNVFKLLNENCTTFYNWPSDNWSPLHPLPTFYLSTLNYHLRAKKTQRSNPVLNFFRIVFYGAADCEYLFVLLIGRSSIKLKWKRESSVSYSHLSCTHHQLLTVIPLHLVMTAKGLVPSLVDNLCKCMVLSLWYLQER